MDRQTKIAFTLIFILFIGYFLYMSRFTSRPEPGTVGTADSLSRSPAEEQLSPESVPQEADIEEASPREEVQVAAEPVFEAAPSREIVVETPRARYRLDSQGAALTRIELLEYDGVESEFVELISPREGEDSAAVLAVDFEGPEGWISSSDWGFNLVSGAPMDTLRLSPGAEETLVFRASDGQGGSLDKSYTFFADSYDFLLDIDAELEGGLAGTSTLGIDWSRGIPSTEKNRKDDVNSFRNYYKIGENQENKKVGNFKDGKGLPEKGFWSEEGTLQWVATKNKYFLCSLIPEQLMSGNAVLVGDHEDEYLGWRAEYVLRGNRRSFNEGFKVYAGPLIYEDLKTHGRGLERLVDMGTLIRPISLAIKWLMDFLSRFIPNYGVIIILMSVITKFLFYRLTHKSFKSMKEMQMLQPEIKGLQEKYKDNKEQLNKAMMALYKERGVNPLGGCFPLLLQMPVFFALYRVLRGAVELRGAGFTLWIDDLASPDVIYRLPFEIPIIGGFIDNAICVLPILMGLSMWIQQKLGGSGMGMGNGQPASQMAAMNKIMPFFMTFIFYRFPSGLVLYWLVNNILTAVQQYYIHKGLEKNPNVVSAGA